MNTERAQALDVAGSIAFAARGSGATPLETRWTATGRQRHVVAWFGFAKIWIEEHRMIYRGRGPTPKPEYWTPQTRWRRARRRDRDKLAVMVTFENGEIAA